jgi:hypothetical protein
MKKEYVMGNKINYQPIDILLAIIFKCLWNEPCQLSQILEKLENEFSVDMSSIDEFLKCTSRTLGKAILAEIIRKKSGFYILTAEGRKKADGDEHLVSKRIQLSLQETNYPVIKEEDHANK